MANRPAELILSSRFRKASHLALKKNPNLALFLCPTSLTALMCLPSGPTHAPSTPASAAPYLLLPGAALPACAGGKPLTLCSALPKGGWDHHLPLQGTVLALHKMPFVENSRFGVVLKWCILSYKQIELFFGWSCNARHAKIHSW